MPGNSFGVVINCPQRNLDYPVIDLYLIGNKVFVVIIVSVEVHHRVTVSKDSVASGLLLVLVILVDVRRFSELQPVID